MADQDSTHRHSTRNVRRVRRVRTPVSWYPWGWFLLGCLGLVFVFALGPWAQVGIERRALLAAERALSESGERWATVEVDGQWVTLRGEAPDRAAAERAKAAVREGQVPTLLGMALPVIWVGDEFDYADAPADTPSAPAPEWVFRLSDGVLHLEGEVPDAAVRKALEAKARAAIDPPRIVDVHNQLVVAEGADLEGFAEVAERGLDNVVQCDMGVAEFSCDRYSLLCELPEARAEAVQAAARAPLPLGRVGTVQVLANEAVASCEQAMAEVLARSTLRFATSSDEIDSSSGSVLDEVATAAKDCPGTLRIEGHTDRVGDPAFNDDLSRRRAESVRRALIRRGLPATRLVAQGFGSRKPVSDNQTAAGRSRNRRIEIRVVRASD